MAFPTVTPDPTKTVVINNALVTWTPTGGVAMSFGAKKVTITPKTEFIKHSSPSGGMLRVDRVVPTKHEKTVKLEIDEFVQGLLDPFMSVGTLTGTMSIWGKDPDDAALTAAMKTNAFGCTLVPEGDLVLDREAFSGFTLNAQVTSPDLTLSLDAAA